ncbi:MAG TPA: cytochrome-c peroxidase [Thiotrichales bacterium]|nr:cytochrome-c peroxidase [Thiotrichales bacterium]
MASACVALTACSNDSSDIADDVISMVKAAGMTGDPTAGRTLPAINDPKAQLGKKLFFTKGLGGDDDSACVTCHHPVLGGGDNLSLPIGVGAETPDLLGPGRFHSAAAKGGVFDGGPTVPRNAPTTFNLGMWDQALFHDGRVESLGKTPGANGNDGAGIRTPDSAFGVADPDAGDTLAAAQSRFPITSPEEMRGFTFEAGNSNAVLRTALEAKLTAAGGWDAEFTAAYGDATITHTRIAEAIGEYERSQVFVNSPWKAFVNGDKNAISNAAKRGAMKFFSSRENGGANCSSCHAGDFFTDEQYHVMATPQIGRGKGNDNGTLQNDDFGRFRESKDPADKYKFRTPSLLNVEVTGPWGHAGAYTTLDGMVRHMLNPEQAIANYDFSQLNPTVQAADMLTNTQFALNQLAANRAANVAGVHQNVAFSDEDVSDLVEFLKTLTDPCVKDRSCLAPWIPDAGDTNPDGLRVNAIDNTGAFL